MADAIMSVLSVNVLMKVSLVIIIKISIIIILLLLVSHEFFCHLDHTGNRTDITNRPELLYGSVEYIATKDYCKVTPPTNYYDYYYYYYY